jgi:hypothetical protein
LRLLKPCGIRDSRPSQYPGYSQLYIFLPSLFDRTFGQFSNTRLSATFNACWIFQSCGFTANQFLESIVKKFLCMALLAMAFSADAQVNIANEKPRQNYVNYPQYSAPNKESFNWNAVAPTFANTQEGKPAGSGQLTPAAYPSDIVNGSFDDNTGWLGVQFFQTSPFAVTGLDIRPLMGNQVDYLASFCLYTPTPQCPTGGYIEQSVHVEPGKRLGFESGITVGNFGLQASVAIFDARTAKLLADFPAPAYTNIGNGKRYSEIDLARMAGLDITVRFYAGYGNLQSSGGGVWVDAIKILDAPASTYSGQAQQGNWYNPLRSGSGWDIRRAPDGTFYALWFTYNQAGKPVWYISGQGAFINGVLDAPLYVCTRAGGTGACAIKGNVQLSLRSSTAGVMRFDFNDQGSAGTWDGVENFEFLVANGGGYSGHFHSDDAADSAWGVTSLSFVDNQNRLQLMAPIYYYDGAGESTWSIAAQAFNNNQTMGVSRLTGGLCPTCVGTFPTITQTSVGSLRLNFDVADQSSLIGEMYLSNPTWNRPARRFYKLSN